MSGEAVDAAKHATATESLPESLTEEPEGKRFRRTPSVERVLIPKSQTYAEIAELPDFWERLEQEGKSKGKGKGKDKNQRAFSA